VKLIKLCIGTIAKVNFGPQAIKTLPKGQGSTNNPWNKGFCLHFTHNIVSQWNLHLPSCSLGVNTDHPHAHPLPRRHQIVYWVVNFRNFQCLGGSFLRKPKGPGGLVNNVMTSPSNKFCASVKAVKLFIETRAESQFRTSGRQQGPSQWARRSTNNPKNKGYL